MEFFGELWCFMNARKKLWILPLLAVMLLLGAILALAEHTAVAPFIYTLF